MTAPGSSVHGAEQPVGAVHAAEPDLADADRIRAAVLGCPDVADLAAGPFNEVASYLPGRTVPGVRVDDEHVEVHIIANYGQPLRQVANQIGASVQGLLRGRPLNVCVDDILLPGETLTASEHAPPDPSGDQ